MAFPVSPTNGQIFQDYIYTSTRWKKYVEKFIRVTNSSVPEWNSIIENSASVIFDATSKVPSNAMAIELRAWFASSANNTYNLIEYGPASESVIGDGKHASFGSPNVVINGYTHCTFKVYLDSNKRFKIFAASSNSGTINFNSSIVGYYTI